MSGGAVIGTIRLIPMDRGLAPCEAILQRQSLLGAEYYESSWEVGRLVIAPQYRSGAETLKRCLFLTLLFLVRTTSIQNGFAMCHPALSRLYRRCGFSVVVKEVMTESTAEPMSLIHGRASTVLLALVSSAADRVLAEQELARRAERRMELPA